MKKGKKVILQIHWLEEHLKKKKKASPLTKGRLKTLMDNMDNTGVFSAFFWLWLQGQSLLSDFQTLSVWQCTTENKVAEQ